MSEGTPQANESVSALIDGELSPGDSDAVIKMVAGDDELRARWTRYHAGRAALRGRSASISPDFADRIQQHVAAEPVVIGPLARRSGRGQGWSRLGQRATGFAVAASVGALALAGLLTLRDAAGPAPVGSTEIALGEEARVEAPAQVVSRGGVTAPMLRPSGITTASVPVGARAPEIDPALSALLGEYVTTHAVFAGSSGMPGLIRSGRLAGHRPDH